MKAVLLVLSIPVYIACSSEAELPPERPPEDSSFISRPPPIDDLSNPPEEGIREAPVIDLKVEVPVEIVATAVIAAVVTKAVVVKAAPAQAVPATGQLADVIARHFVEQPAKALRVVMCESTGDPTIVGGGVHYGLWQFTVKTWQSVGGVGLPTNASAEEQTMRARMLYNREGWSPWPVCGRL